MRSPCRDPLGEGSVAGRDLVFFFGCVVSLFLCGLFSRSRGYSLVTVHGFIAVASLVVEHGHGTSGCGARA